MTEWQTASYKFSGKTVDVLFSFPFDQIEKKVGADNIVYITDENVYKHYARKFPLGKTIVLPAGETFKTQETVDKAIEELMLMEVGRDVFIIGVGGGIVTDISGFIASIYMRGVSFAFVPTSVLAMVDAAIGGKNGINVGLYKNQLGVIRQPEYLFFDFSMLATLPTDEWISGFAEIIKHACIKDAAMFDFLKQHVVSDFKKDLSLAAKLIRQNADLKYRVVAEDETENGERRLLNFGHTLGHAIEQSSGLAHGFAISIGMVFACRLSEKINGFPTEKTESVIQLLQQYLLPVNLQVNKEKTWEIILHDKKKTGNHLHFILLDDIGKGIVKKIPLAELKELFFEIE